jgi:hypothetical protein
MRHGCSWPLSGSAAPLTRLTKVDDLDLVTRAAQAKPTKTQVCADNNFHGGYHAPVANKSDF